MLPQSLPPLLVFALAATSIGGILLAVFFPRAARLSPYRRRFAALAAPDAHPREAGGADDDHDRRRTVERTLREMEAKQKSKAKKAGKVALPIRLAQADLRWSVNTYYLVGIACALASYVAALSLGATHPAAAGFAVTGGLMLPHLYVNAKRNGRLNRFSAEFPNAVDVVVRGLKAGLPVADCLRVIASEAQEPVRSEFLLIVQDQTLGIPLEEAVQRMRDRVPLPEASFFAIVIAIQSRTGGSLSEALGNLSKVLRDRKKMKAKIKAMSAEAKSSAGIIGFLPIFVAGAVYFTSPDYMSLLFSTAVGKVVLAGCGLWMATGILVMRKMINFDF